MSSYQYRKSHCGDKTVVRSSYLHNGISFTGKISSLYWIGVQVWVHSLWSCDAIWRLRSGAKMPQAIKWLAVWRHQDNAWTKPVPEPMLTCHQRYSVAFTLEQLHSEIQFFLYIMSLKMRPLRWLIIRLHPQAKVLLVLLIISHGPVN